MECRDGDWETCGSLFFVAFGMAFIGVHDIGRGIQSNFKKAESSPIFNFLPKSSVKPGKAHVHHSSGY